MVEPPPREGYWRRSTVSGQTGECVEVSFAGEAVLVRNSRQPDGPQLSFTLPEWAAFLAGVTNGEFDPTLR